MSAANIRKLPAIIALLLAIVSTYLLYTSVFTFRRNFLDSFFTFVFFCLVFYVIVYALSDRWYPKTQEKIVQRSESSKNKVKKKK